MSALADKANELARASRRGGAPRLSADASREAVLEWLQWHDPNGCWLDDRMFAEFGDDEEPLSLGEAWGALEEMLKDA